MDDKISGQNFEKKQDTSTDCTYHCKMLINYKEKKNSHFSLEKHGRHHLNQTIKGNMTIMRHGTITHPPPDNDAFGRTCHFYGVSAKYA